MAVGEIPKGARRSDLDSACKVMQIDASNRSIRAIPRLAYFWSYGLNLAMLGGVFSLGRCAAHTAGEDAHSSA